MVLQISRTKPLQIEWEALPDDYILPDDPVENIQQPYLAAALTDALGEAGLIRPEMLIGSNFGLVARVNEETVVKAPDWFYVPRAEPLPTQTIRRSYTPHRQGDPVAIVMEFLSDTEESEFSVRPFFPYGKLFFYENILQVPTYAIFNPYDVELRVLGLEAGQYRERQANDQGRYWIPELGLWLGIWHGSRLGQKPTNWLRWWDEAGNLLLWSAEKAEQERQRAEAAEQELARLREQITRQSQDLDEG
ncbi:Uma2 family endonuclease [Romeria aff. gracilis LEGE 07310]|uniref:Uma2 family endonuclease n=1 Tax=Vasconcelosia minhoensis LEGE 07310 TaxID=915328 RepID=A0A8J7ANG7_9CYAN|nr:Uma2 family endonuclease [Romeria gracilis]MBE9077709.1 Uma2 family endonuclease [Romeria aff. gracilis LEGE 07310]